MLNEETSIFSIRDFVSCRPPALAGHLKNRGPVGSLLRLVPRISENVKGKANCERFLNRLLNIAERPQVLVLGAGNLGAGMEALANCDRVQLVETDVEFRPRIMVICDAHDIPFENECFDGVIIQAVLEHVVDPHRCVQEAHRVLKKNGLIYAETPFIQQVHGGRHDFTRFTHLGHRRLFRKFDELESGVVCGPGMALAWSYKYFLQSLTRSSKLNAILGVFAHLTSFYLKYFDYLLADNPGALDAASAYYFVGKRAEHTLSDRELVSLYRGAG